MKLWGAVVLGYVAGLAAPRSMVGALPNHFEVLGVNPKSSDAQIKKAYKALARKHHPDKGGDQSVFIELTRAYEVLVDSAKKKEYLDELRYGSEASTTFHRRGRSGGRRQPFNEEEEEVFVFRSGNGQQFFYSSSSSGRQGFQHHFHDGQQFFQQPTQMPYWLQVAILVFNMSSATWLLILGSCFFVCAACSGTTSDTEGKEGREVDLECISLKALNEQPLGEVYVVSLCAPCREVLSSPAFCDMFRNDHVSFLSGEVQPKFTATGLLAVAVRKRGSKWSGLILRRKREVGGAEVEDEQEAEDEVVDTKRAHRLLQKFVTKVLNGETQWISTDDYPLPLLL